MPMYQFIDESGAGVEHYFPMSDAPKIGDEIDIDGKTVRRVPSDATISADVENRVHGYPYVSRSMCRNSGVEGTKFTNDGKPIISSRRHEREMMAKHGLVRD